MKQSIRKGFGFGLTSGIITTLGLIVGLNSGTHSKNVVIAGILIIAFSDALSDSFGMHISEESGKRTISRKSIWESTISTFLFKLIFALTFIVPVLLFSLTNAVMVSILWGIILISSFTYYISKINNHNPVKAIFEHLIIAFVVIILSNYIGEAVSIFF